jgi:hypothetical protein
LIGYEPQHRGGGPGDRGMHCVPRKEQRAAPAAGSEHIPSQQV